LHLMNLDFSFLLKNDMISLNTGAEDLTASIPDRRNDTTELYISLID